MQTKPITVRSFLDIHYVSNPQFSEDARYISYTVTTVDAEGDSYLHDLYLYDRNTKKNRRMSDRGDIGGVTWTKDNTMLFSAMRSEADKKRAEAGDLFTVFYEIDPAGGEALRAFEVPYGGARIIDQKDDLLLLMYDLDLSRPRKKKDGGTLSDVAFAKAYADWKKKRFEGISEYPIWFNGAGFVSGHRSLLAIYDRKKKKAYPVTKEETDVSAAYLTDTAVLFTGQPRKDGAKDKIPQAVSLDLYFEGLYRYDLRTKRTKEIVKPGEQDLSLLGVLNDKQALLFLTDYKTGPLQFPAFFTCDLKTGQIRPYFYSEISVGTSVGSDARQGAGQQFLLRDGVLTFVSTIDESAYLMQLQNRTLTKIATPSGSVEAFDLAKDGALVVSMLTDNAPAELFLNGKRITQINRAFTSRHTLITPEKLTFKNKDGIEIRGFVMKPAGYRKGRSYPAILHIHGGPLTVFSPFLHHEMQYWAQNGYFVFFCNPRGSDGRGNAFADISGKYGSIDYDDLMAFTDRVLRAYPAIDKKRVGVTGGSYGGFMTNWIIGHTNRFACACSQRSIANWTTFEYTSDIGVIFTKLHQGKLTRDNVKSLWDHSPIKYADKAKTPTLFVCGDADYRCYHADSVAMYTALKENGTPTRLALFHGESHELSRSGKPSNRISRMEEILGFMDTWLK